MLHRVETGTKSPSVDLLHEIANVCRKPIYEFFDDLSPGFQKLDPDKLKTIRTKISSVRIICPYGVISKDMIVSQFKGIEGAEIKLQSHRGYCWVYILRGACVFEHNGIAYHLKAGDSFYYDADKPQKLKVLSALESVRITVRR